MVGWDRILAQTIEKKCSGAPGETRCLEVTGPRYAGQAGKELSLRWWCDNIVGSMRAGK